METKVVIADDHAIIREGLKSLLENRGITVLEIAKNGREAIDSAIQHKPDIVIMDISMPDLNGVEATAAIREKVPGTKVIGLSMHSGKHIIDQMFASGASGYILKESAFEELHLAILEIQKGNYYLTPSIARMYAGPEENSMVFPEEMDQSNKSKGLSKKEKEVLLLVAEGLKTKDIADRMNLSIKTVESHRRNIMKKLNIFSVAGLTKYVLQDELVKKE